MKFWSSWSPSELALTLVFVMACGSSLIFWLKHIMAQGRTLWNWNTPSAWSFILLWVVVLYKTVDPMTLVTPRFIWNGETYLTWITQHCFVFVLVLHGKLLFIVLLYLYYNCKVMEIHFLHMCFKDMNGFMLPRGFSALFTPVWSHVFRACWTFTIHKKISVWLQKTSSDLDVCEQPNKENECNPRRIIDCLLSPLLIKIWNITFRLCCKLPYL